MAEDHRFRPVAVVGRRPDLLDEELRCADLGPDAAYRALDAALDAVACDAVVVCSPVELHARDLRCAFAAGKDVLVEKCLSNDWVEACSLVAEAEAAGVILVVAQNYRYTPDNQALHHAVTSGRYGAPMLVDLTLHKYRPAPRQQDYPFAMFWDQGCHHVDVLQWVLGPIVEATARTFSAPWSAYRDDAAIQALLRFESGAVWSYLLSNVSRATHHQFLLHSEEGCLAWSPDGWRWSAAAAPEDVAFGWNDPPVTVDVPAAAPRSGEEGVLEAFARAVRTRAPTEISGRPNLETLRVCEMVRRAGLTGRPVARDSVR